VGTKNITVSYSGISKQIPITVVSQNTINSLTGITVDKVTNNSYIVGETYFDRSSIKVTAIFSDGTTSVLANDEYNISGFDTSSAGTNIVTVSYLGYTKPVAVQVLNKTLINVAFTAPSKTLYSVGDAIDKTGLNMTATYDDGSTADVTSNSEISGFDTSSAGTKTVRVTYMGITKTYNIVVTGTVSVTGITVTDYTRSYLEFAAFDNNLTVYASFSDGTVKQLDSGYEISGFDSSKSGVNKVTVTYMDKKATFDVIIIPVNNAANILGITATLVGSNEYIIGAPQFDRSSISVTAINSDGTEEVIDDYSISGFETSVAGSKTITISYLGFNQTIEIKVTNKSVMGISVKAPTKLTYTQGESFNTAGMNVMAFYTDGTQSDVTGQSIIGGFDSSVIGTQTVSVIYGDKSQSFEITIEPSMSSLYSITLDDARISRSNKVTTKITAVNTTDNAIVGELVLAVYEKNEDGTMGKLAGMSITDAVLTNGTTNLTPSCDAGDTTAEEFFVIAYLWQDMNSMVPITEKTVFEI
jgi:hypothetical protein